MSFTRQTPYTSFREVRLCEPIVARIMRAGGTPSECVVALANDRLRLLRRIEELESIAPKKIRTPDGVAVWHCPDELIPLT